MKAATVLLALALALAVGIHGAAGAGTTYDDGLGDSPCCLDIDSVSVSNDEAGMITFRVGLPKQADLPAGRIVGIWLNTDLNRATGGTTGFPAAQLSRRTGADYLVRFDPTGDTKAVLIRMTANLIGTVVSTLGAVYDRGWTTTVDRRLIGGPASFEFFVSAAYADPGTRQVWVDDAPDVWQGLWGWRYDTGLPPLVAKATLTAGRAALAPNPPRAGRRLVASVPFELTSTEGIRVRVRCSARAGSRVLREASAVNVRENVHLGRAVCAWVVPQAARGTVVRGTVIVIAGGASVARSFVARAR